MKGPRKFQTLRGFRDIVPQEQKYWRRVSKTFEEIADAYSFLRIDLPILEETALFKKSIGDDTDIVEKEMFSFADQSGDNITLRPEGTAGAVRAYVEHGMVNFPQPVKLYYEGPMFRYERPQAGRFRQFYQIGAEIIGGGESVVDAEVIAVSYNVCSALGLKVSIEINSIGSGEERENYKKILQDFYRPKRNLLCEDCKKRFTKNPLRLLDCKEEQCQEFKDSAPQLVDNLSEEDKNHFIKVLEHLDEAEIPYVLNPFIVRGLDYYTKTIFEICPQEIEVSGDSENQQGSTSAIGGGGRYDGLVELLGGNPTPACGVALGVDRLVQLMKTQKIIVEEDPQDQVFLAQLGEEAKKRSLKLFEILRLGGIKVKSNFSKDGLKPQLETANKLGVKFTLILGQKEIMDGTLLIRDMENGIQEIVDFNKAVSEIKKRLEKSQEIIVSNGAAGSDTESLNSPESTDSQEPQSSFSEVLPDELGDEKDQNG